MRFILIFLFWIAAAIATGFIGALIGPGAVMVFAGALMGVCGGFIHVAASLLGLQLRWWNVGFVVSLVTLLCSFIIFGSATRHPPIAFFLFIFYAIASTLIFLAIDHIKTLFRSTNHSITK